MARPKAVNQVSNKDLQSGLKVNVLALQRWANRCTYFNTYGSKNVQYICGIRNFVIIRLRTHASLFVCVLVRACACKNGS